MANNKIDQVLNDSQLWKECIPNTIRSIAENTYLSESYYNTRSRTLQDALNHTLGYYGSNSYTYKILRQICTLVTNEKIKIIPGYDLITSENAENLDIYNIINYRYSNTNTRHIFLWHIPKGKSYLKKALDKQTELIRLKQIETFCIEDVSHFVRIYRGFGQIHPKDIIIFSDRFTLKFIQTLFIMLPHLFEILPRESTEEYQLTAEDTSYNEKVTDLRAIFKKLFDIYQESSTNAYTYDDQAMANIRQDFTTLFNHYLNHFDFVTTQINSFTQHLAKIKNDTTNKYFTDQLNAINNTIQNYEDNLTEAYVKKANYERQLIANKHITEADVKPFIDTINNTKAIEILQATDSMMQLKITAPLQYFISSDFEAYEHNSTSDYNSMYRDKPYIKKILHKTFVTREYKMLVQGIITIQLSDSNYCSSPIYYSAQRGNLSDFSEFPNPHLYHYDCWGKAKTEMNKNLNEGNFELVVMQMVAAVQSVNIAENASFLRGLLNDLLNDNFARKTHFIDQNNKIYTFKELIDYEKELEKQETIQQAKNIISQTPKNTYTQVEIPDDDANWSTPANIRTHEEIEENENEEN